MYVIARDNSKLSCYKEQPQHQIFVYVVKVGKYTEKLTENIQQAKKFNSVKEAEEYFSKYRYGWLDGEKYTIKGVI